MKILLAIPAYNCEKQIVRVLEKLHQTAGSFFSEIIIINNQSKDSTLKSAQQYALKHTDFKFRIVSNSENIGLGGSHKMAFQYAIDNNLDGCTILHGDDQGEILDLLKCELNLNEYFFGSRFSYHSILVNYSKIRIVGNFFFNSIASLLTLNLISDFGGSGLNFFPTRLIRQHNFWQYPDDLTFHPFVLLNSIRMKQKLTYFPILWSESDQISNVKLASQTIKLFKILSMYLRKMNLVDKSCKANKPDFAKWI